MPAGEVPHGSGDIVLTGAEGIRGDSLPPRSVALGARVGPASQLIPHFGVERFAALGVVHQVQHGLHMPCVGNVQPGAFEQGGAAQPVQDVVRDLLVGEGVAAGVPLADSGVE